MPHGYTGKILHVDLSSGMFSVEEPEEILLPEIYGRQCAGHVLPVE